MITEDKVIELFCNSDDFCKFFDAMMAKYTTKEVKSGIIIVMGHITKAEVMLT